MDEPVTLTIVPLVPGVPMPRAASARTRVSVPAGYGVQEQCLPFTAAGAGRTRGEDAMSRLSRRDVVTATGAAAAAALGSAPREAAAQQPRAAQPTTYLFFNADEVAFVEAAIARLIPADEQWPGALEAGVANFIDKELNGAWGAGERLYRSCPFRAAEVS